MKSLTPVAVLPKAKSDLEEIIDHYNAQRPGLGGEFLIEVRAALKRAAENPGGYRRVARSPEVRRVRPDRFPYAIYYVRESQAIVVFRVVHGHRKAGTWKHDVPR